MSVKYNLKRLNNLVERVVFESKWVLAPLNIGLIVAMALFGVRFLIDGYQFMMHGFHLEMEQLIVELLGLVDAYMVTNLLIMIIKGSYQIFIHKFNLSPDNKEGWLDHIDTGLLKVKTAQSIASITGVALLKDFVNADRMSWTLVTHRLIVHSVCLVSAWVMAKIWVLTQEPHEPAGHAH